MYTPQMWELLSLKQLGIKVTIYKMAAIEQEELLSDYNRHHHSTHPSY